MSDGVLYNADGDYITDWFWWTPFSLMFISPVVAAIFMGAIGLAVLLAVVPAFLIIMQKFWPI